MGGERAKPGEKRGARSRTPPPGSVLPGLADGSQREGEGHDDDADDEDVFVGIDYHI